MSSAFWRGKTLVIKYKNEHGRQEQKRTKAKTKTEAKRLASELEQKCERQRLKLEPRVGAVEIKTLFDLLQLWIAGWFKFTFTYDRSIGTIRKHLLDSELAALPITEAGAKAEAFLKTKERERCARTANHLRGYLSQAFRWAIRKGHYVGANPIADVKKFKVQRQVGDYLRPHEVPLVIAAILDTHRNLFATAIYTGLRLGELAALRKTAVDFGTGLITVARSWSRDVTKGRHVDVLPIAKELEPYLRAAVESAKGDLVFPRLDGSMKRRSTQLGPVLRTALRRAGIVTGYRHSCRRAGCGHVEHAADDMLRRCPKCNMKLWPHGEVRKIRFHDLRHTTASLLMMAGANPAAVQRIMRHTDPKITTEVYGHLAPGYHQAEVNRLSFGLTGPSNTGGAESRTTGAPKSLEKGGKARDHRDRPASEGATDEDGYDDLPPAVMDSDRLWDQDVGGSNPLAPTL